MTTQDFVKAAQTRIGCPFNVETVQTDPNGNPVTMKGTVTPPLKDGSPGTATKMCFWNMQGVCQGNGMFSLIIPVALADFTPPTPAS